MSYTTFGDVFPTERLNDLERATCFTVQISPAQPFSDNDEMPPPAKWLAHFKLYSQ